MTSALILVYLATLLVGGYLWHRDRTGLTADHADEIADLNAVHRQAAAATEDDHATQTQRWIETLGRVIGDLERARLDAEWATVVLAVTEAERDTFRTAFTAEMQRQARLELVQPDEPVGEAKVISIKAARS